MFVILKKVLAKAAEPLEKKVTTEKYLKDVLKATSLPYTNKAKRFAKQLASEVYQNKAHFNSQVCYDKAILVLFSTKLLCLLGASIQNYIKSQVC